MQKHKQNLIIATPTCWMTKLNHKMNENIAKKKKTESQMDEKLKSGEIKQTMNELKQPNLKCLWWPSEKWKCPDEKETEKQAKRIKTNMHLIFFCVWVCDK